MQPRSGLFVAVAVVAMLGGCAVPAPDVEPPPPTPTVEPTSAPLSAPALPAECSDLVTGRDLADVIGTAPALAGGSSDDDPVPYVNLVTRAGGLVDCTWGTNPGSGSGDPGVAVQMVPRTAFDRLSADFGLDECFTYETHVSKVMVTLCDRDDIVNGYYVRVSAVTPDEEDNLAAASRMEEFVGRVHERIATLSAPQFLTTAPESPLDGPLCEAGPETLAAVYGVPATTVVERGHGSDYDIRAAAAERAGAQLCEWAVGDTASWAFETVPDAAWMFDQESIRTFASTSVDPVPLEAVRLKGATAAFAACAAGSGCYSNILVEGSLLRAHGGSSPEQFLAELQKILDAI